MRNCWCRQHSPVTAEPTFLSAIACNRSKSPPVAARPVTASALPIVPVAQVVIDDGGSREPNQVRWYATYALDGSFADEVFKDTITVTRYTADGTPLDDLSALGGGDIVTTTTPTTGTLTLDIPEPDPNPLGISPSDV